MAYLVDYNNEDRQTAQFSGKGLPSKSHSKLHMAPGLKWRSVDPLLSRDQQGTEPKGPTFLGEKERINEKFLEDGIQTCGEACGPDSSQPCLLWDLQTASHH
jgi:hypothetical protein